MQTTHRSSANALTGSLMPGPLFVSLLRRSNFYLADFLQEPSSQSFKEPQSVTPVAFEASKPILIRIVAVIINLGCGGVNSRLTLIERSQTAANSSSLLKQEAFFAYFCKRMLECC
jgi:hypothetical protein